MHSTTDLLCDSAMAAGQGLRCPAHHGADQAKPGTRKGHLKGSCPLPVSQALQAEPRNGQDVAGLE